MTKIKLSFFQVLSSFSHTQVYNSTAIRDVFIKKLLKFELQEDIEAEIIGNKKDEIIFLKHENGKL